jgi:hypothetical protein
LFSKPKNWWSTWNSGTAYQYYYILRVSGSTVLALDSAANAMIAGFGDVKYLQLFLMGGGGGGAGAGGSLQHSGAGGGGGAAASVCIRVPTTGYATLTVGYGGAGGTGYGDGAPGGYTRIDCGGFYCQCGAGAKGLSGSSSTNTSAGGVITYSGNNADGYLQSYHNGGYGAAKNNAGENRLNATFYEHAPENASITNGGYGGGSGGSSGGGGGGGSPGRYVTGTNHASNYVMAFGGAGGNGGAGSSANYGGGGGGGDVGFLTQHAGGKGGGGTAFIAY